MPHENSAHWLSQVLGREVEYRPLSSAQDLIDSRAGQSAAAEAVNFDLPELAHNHYRIPLRPGAATPTADIHVPYGDGPWPVFMHIHGGAWYTGSVESVRKISMRIAEAGFVVVSIDYARAPEEPFPLGLQDCLYAARWVTQNIDAYGGDPTRFALGGGSCGGNLSAALTLALNGADDGLNGYGLEHVKVEVKAIVLLYAMLDLQLWLSDPHYWAGEVETIAAAYLGPNFTRRMYDPLISPLKSMRLGLMPPTYLSCGVEDALLTHSLEMTRRLAMLDVPATLSVVAGADHEFLRIPHVLPAAKEELDRIIGWLRLHV